MFAASLCVMTVTDSFATDGLYPTGARKPIPDPGRLN
jgi:hypothetical protein